jgi:hypothetical protein
MGRRLEVILLGLAAGCVGPEDDTGRDTSITPTDDTSVVVEATMNVTDLDVTAQYGEMKSWEVSAQHSDAGVYDVTDLTCTFDLEVPGFEQAYEGACTGTFDSATVSALPYDTTGTFTVTDLDGLKGGATVSVNVKAGEEGSIVLSGFESLEGKTNTVLGTTGEASEGQPEYMNAWLTGEVADVASVSSELIDTQVTVDVRFDNDINWKQYNDGDVTGTLHVEVCDGDNSCTTAYVDVVGTAPGKLNVHVEDLPYTNDLANADVDVTCDSGDKQKNLTTGASGDVTVYLNTTQGTCEVVTSKGSDYYVHTKTHDVTAETDVEVQLLQNVDVGSTFGQGFAHLGGALEVVGYANHWLYFTDGTWADNKTLIRPEEGAITDTIKVYVEKTYYGSSQDVSSTSTWTTMSSTIDDAIAEYNTQSPVGAVFERTYTRNDAHAVAYLHNTTTSATPGFDSTSHLMETAGTGSYSLILLEDGSSSSNQTTVLAELNNLFMVDTKDLGNNGLDAGSGTMSNVEKFCVEVTLNYEDRDLSYFTQP